MKTLQDDILKFQERFCYEDEYGNWGIRGDSGVEFHVIEDLLEYLNPYFREPSTEQSGGTEQEIEKVFDWAKCGIYHNHAYNEDKLRDCLDVLERVMKLLNRKP